jgi:glyoxylase I family protein
MQPTRSPETTLALNETRSIRLDHAAIMTTQLDAAIDFYVRFLGLELRCVEEDPIRRGRRRALLTDAHDREVLELIEMPELAHPTIPGRGGLHHLGFRLPRADWQALRARLDAAGYPYQEMQQRLFVRDADGLVLEIEPLP